MNQLFNCKNVKWNGNEYEELPEQKETTIEDYKSDGDDDEDDDEETE